MGEQRGSIDPTGGTETELNDEVTTLGDSLENTATTSTDVGAGLKLDFTKDIITSSTTGGVVTVITQQPIRDQSITPSISWRIPTITTNELPTGAFVSSSSGAGSLGSLNNNSSSYSFGSVSSIQRSYTLATILSSSNSVPISYSSGPISYSTSSSSSTPITTTTNIPITTTTSSSSSTTSNKTTTVTHYYEDLTYTQVYVLTNRYTSLTTSLLATTSFYADQLSATYEISPPAITTDAASFKELYNLDLNMKSSPSLSKGATAGISIGVILGVLILLISFGVWIRRRHPQWLPFKSKGKIYINKDLGNDDEERGFHHILGKVNEDDPFDIRNGGFQMRNLRPAPNVPNGPNDGISSDEGYHTPELNNNPIFEDSPEFSLFNMKSNFQTINDEMIPPPLPPLRKNHHSANDQLLGLSSIIKDSSNGESFDNHKKFITPPLTPPVDYSPGKSMGGPPDIRDVLRGTPPPILDRSMGIVYESVSEHDLSESNVIRRSLHRRHNSEELGDDLKELIIPYYKKRGPPSPLMLQGGDEINENGSPKSPFSNENDWYRGRSGSVPKRYESLSESVNNLKLQLKIDDKKSNKVPNLPPPRKTSQVVDSFSVVGNSHSSSLSEEDSL